MNIIENFELEQRKYHAERERKARRELRAMQSRLGLSVLHDIVLEKTGKSYGRRELLMILSTSNIKEAI